MFFADRAFAISADVDVTDGDVVSLIDAASKIGFVEWQFTNPDGLAAYPSH